MNKKYILIGMITLLLLAVSVQAVTKQNSQGNRIYDVNRDGVINYRDAGKCWVYLSHPEDHNVYGDLLYDVNIDGVVDDDDMLLIWQFRD